MNVPGPDRTAVFVSHANPEDNAFALWLGAKLAALGYEVWADVLSLRGGQDWQRRLEQAIRERAIKVLFVGTPASVAKQGVRNEIQIAHDVGKRVGDTEFIIPLRLGEFDAPFLVAHAQYIDFSRSWSEGLTELLDTLHNTYRVPRSPDTGDAQWQEIQTIHAKSLSSQRETLTSSWLAISALPRTISLYQFTSSGAGEDLDFKLKTCRFPVVPFGAGCLSTASLADLASHFGLDALSAAGQLPLETFVRRGWKARDIEPRIALNHFSDLTRQAVDRFFHERGLNGFELANNHLAWWAPVNLAPAGQVPFDWSGLSGSRQIQGFSPKRRIHWHFGVTAVARINPVKHLRLKSRLIFTEDGSKPLGEPRRMHRLRRSFAKSWRNPRWRDMLLAFLSWLSEDKRRLIIPMGSQASLVAHLPPIRFNAPISVPAANEVLEIDDDSTEELEEAFEEDWDDEEDAEESDG